MKLLKVYGMLILSLLTLTGCMTLHDEKMLVVPPSDQPTIVKSNARTECQDYFFFYQCKMWLDLTKVSESK